jgi:hypothetical protein
MRQFGQAVMKRPVDLYSGIGRFGFMSCTDCCEFPILRRLLGFNKADADPGSAGEVNADIAQIKAPIGRCRRKK